LSSPSANPGPPQDDARPRSLFALFELPDVLTLAGAASGLVAVGASFEGALDVAAVLLVFSAACDRFDGKLARYLGRKHGGFGAELDNLADAIGFGVAPAALGFAVGLRSIPEVVLLVVFTLAGISRLARFAYVKMDGPYYAGMPITYNGYIFPIAYLLVGRGPPLDLRRGTFAALFGISTLLMASSLRWRKI
jgi:CDP-diacylglycerol--serine O-phosphatidyltransferase